MKNVSNWIVVVLFAAAFMTDASAAEDRMSLSFDRVPVIQFIEATYRSMLGKQYVVDPRLVDDTRRVTIQVKDVSKGDLEPFVKSILADSGVTVEDRNGVSFFLPSSAVDKLVSNPVAPVSVPSVLSATPSIISDPVAPVKPLATHMQLYKPKFRPVDQLQIIANNLLGTAFKDTESVILAGDEDRVAKVLNLLDQQDTRPGEVVVRAAVYEFSQSDNDAMNLQGALTVLASKLNVALGPAAVLQNAISFRNTSLQAVLSAVAGDSRFTLVSSPSLRVRNATKARLTVGAETPVLDSLQLDKNGTPIQSITYRPSGVILELVPTVMAERIEMDVRQEVSSFSKTLTSEINSPTLMKRSLQTVVSIDPGELVVLGGLDEDRSSASSNGLSFLPAFLHSRQSDQTKTQLLLVMEVKRL